MGRVPWLLLPVCAVLPPPIRNSPAHSTELLPEQHLILQLLRALGKAMEKKEGQGAGTGCTISATQVPAEPAGVPKVLSTPSRAQRVLGVMWASVSFSYSPEYR